METFPSVLKNICLLGSLVNTFVTSYVVRVTRAVCEDSQERQHVRQVQ